MKIGAVANVLIQRYMRLTCNEGGASINVNKWQTPSAFQEENPDKKPQETRVTEDGSLVRG